MFIFPFSIGAACVKVFVILISLSFLIFVGLTAININSYIIYVGNCCRYTIGIFAVTSRLGLVGRESTTVNPL